MPVSKLLAIILIIVVASFSLIWGSILPIEINLHEYVNANEDTTTRISLFIDVGIGILFGWIIFNKGESDKRKRLKYESAEIDRDVSPVVTGLKNYEKTVKCKTIDEQQSLKELKRLKTFLEKAHNTINKKIDYSRDVFAPEHILQLENIMDDIIHMKGSLSEESKIVDASNISEEWKNFDKVFDKQSQNLKEQIDILTRDLSNKYKYDNLKII